MFSDQSNILEVAGGGCTINSPGSPISLDLEFYLEKKYMSIFLSFVVSVLGGHR